VVHSLHFSGALDLTETNALLVPTLLDLTTHYQWGFGKALLFNYTEAEFLVEGEIVRIVVCLRVCILACVLHALLALLGRDRDNLLLFLHF
jgi:hypothetical protein